MRFAEPWAFLALLLVPLSLGVWLWLERRRARQPVLSVQGLA